MLVQDDSPLQTLSKHALSPWMEHHRDDFFLATKTDERLYQPARDQIHRSLERLRVDHVDLLQLHNLTDVADWENTMSPNGALKAVIEAREEGLTRFIGVSGHGLSAPQMHMRSLEHFDFDSVLLPYNYLLMENPEYAADFESLMEICEKRNIAVQTMKSIGRGLWGDKPHKYVTWYEPLKDQTAIDKTVHWVLSRPGIFLNTVGDMRLLPKVLDAVERFESAPADREMQEVVTRRNMEVLFYS